MYNNNKYSDYYSSNSSGSINTTSATSNLTNVSAEVAEEYIISNPLPHGEDEVEPDIKLEVDADGSVNFVPFLESDIVACCKRPEFISDNPKNGTVEIDEDGGMTYTPNEGFLGDDCFYVHIKCTDSQYDTKKLICICVGRCAECDQDFSISMNKALRNNLLCVEGCKGVTLLENVESGTLTIDEQTGDFSYLPENDFFGKVSFTVLLEKSNCEKCYYTVTIDVGHCCEDIDLELDGSQCEDGEWNEFKCLDCTDCKDTRLGVAPQFGTVELDGNNYRYIPNANFMGEDSFCLVQTACGQGCYAIVNVSVGHCCEDIEVTIESAPCKQVAEIPFDCGLVSMCEDGKGNQVPCDENSPCFQLTEYFIIENTTGLDVYQNEIDGKIYADIPSDWQGEGQIKIGAKNGCTYCYGIVTVNGEPPTPPIECEEGFFPYGEICVPLCVNGQCEEGYTPHTLPDGTCICIPLCVDGNCPPGTVCYGEICVPLCVDGECPEGFTPHTLENGTCICIPLCVDGNCPPGTVCYGEICVPLCVDGECPAGFTPHTLENGTCICIPLCVDGNCPPGTVCYGEVCVPLCVNGECPAGFTPHTLEDGTCICIPLCVDGNCPPGTVCYGEICVPICVDGECLEGFTPHTLPDGSCICIPLCVDGNCPPGTVCYGEICVPLCIDGQCPEGFVSQALANGTCICIPLCVDGICPPGTVCVNGVCLPECVDGQCPEGFYCLNGICYPIVACDDEPAPEPAEVVITKTSQQDVWTQENREITFDILVVNQGGEDATDLTVEDLIPDNTELVFSNIPSGTFDLAPGEDRVITVTVTVKPGVTLEDVFNVVTVKSGDGSVDESAAANVPEKPCDKIWCLFLFDNQTRGDEGLKDGLTFTGLAGLCGGIIAVRGATNLAEALKWINGYKNWTFDNKKVYTLKYIHYKCNGKELICELNIDIPEAGKPVDHSNNIADKVGEAINIDLGFGTSPFVNPGDEVQGKYIFSEPVPCDGCEITLLTFVLKEKPSIEIDVQVTKKQVTTCEEIQVKEVVPVCEGDIDCPPGACEFEILDHRNGNSVVEPQNGAYILDDDGEYYLRAKDCNGNTIPITIARLSDGQGVFTDLDILQPTGYAHIFNLNLAGSYSLQILTGQCRLIFKVNFPTAQPKK